MKKQVMIIAAIATISITMVSVAAASPTAIDALSAFAGVQSEEIQQRIDDGERPSDIAKELEVYDQFVESMKAHREERIQYQVENGRLTQEEADVILEKIADGDAMCDEGGFNFKQFNRSGQGNGGQKRGNQ